VRTVRELLTVAGVLVAGAAVAQSPPPLAPGVLPALPQPAEPPPLAPGIVTTLPHPAEQPPPLPTPPPLPVLPGPAVANPVPPVPPDFCPPEGPMLLPLAPCGRPGLFGAVELGLLFPHVKNDLAAPVTVAPFGFTTTVRLPAADLDSTVAPLFVLGYRFRDDLGAVLLSHRNLASAV